MSNLFCRSCQFLIVLPIFFFATPKCYSDTTGKFFNVYGNANVINAYMRICLNGYVPASCQNFQISGEQMTIAPNTNNDYSKASVEMLGDSLKIISACDDIYKGRCIINLQKSTNYTVSLGSTNQNFIFATSENYTGNLGGVLGADEKCQAAAENSGNALLSSRTFKAMLVSSTRYPCDETGNCGGTHDSDDWVLKPNTDYYNSSNIKIAHSNENEVLEQPSKTYVILQDEFSNSLINYGDPNLNTSYGFFWSGVMSIKISNTDPYNIVGWSYLNVNSDSLGYWNSELATCVDWSSSENYYKGSVGLSNISPIMFKTVNGEYVPTTEGAYERLGQWGNYYYFTDDSLIYYTNTWIWADRFTCDNAYSIICVSQSD